MGFGSGQAVLARRQVPEVEGFMGANCRERSTVGRECQWDVATPESFHQVGFLSQRIHILPAPGVEEYQRALVPLRGKELRVGRKENLTDGRALPALEAPE